LNKRSGWRPRRGSPRNSSADGGSAGSPDPAEVLVRSRVDAARVLDHTYKSL
jgi:hypothetical protein